MGFEAIVNYINHFFKVDAITSSTVLSTFTHIVININISISLPGDVVLMVGDRPWIKSLIDEGLSFHCLLCFSTSNLATNCSLPFHKGIATLWKDAHGDHLTILASYSSFDYSSQDGDDS